MKRRCTDRDDENWEPWHSSLDAKIVEYRVLLCPPKGLPYSSEVTRNPAKSSAGVNISRGQVHSTAARDLA